MEPKNKFGIHPATARKMVREGKLEVRVVKDEVGKDYFYIFLVKENKNLI